MSFKDPRGSLYLPSFQLPQSNKLQPSRRSFPQLPRPKLHHKSKRTPCYDWIFSSATNIHIAIDKSWFKTFTPFETYVLTIAGQQQISVRGIGSVEIKIRCKPGGHQSRIITLDNVLYVPGWSCNILSDIYFEPTNEYEFEHKWSQHGVCFVKKQAGKIKHWGYTESFCGLDRLVLSRKPQGRSPMLEDKDREVWSVNLNWPQSQRDKWQAFRDQELERLAKEHEAEIVAQQEKANKQGFTESTELLLPKNSNKDSPNPRLKSPKSPSSVAKVSVRAKSEGNLHHVLARQVSSAELELEYAGARMSLNEINANRGIKVKQDPDSRVSSLKASFTANRALLKDLLAAKSDDKENISHHERNHSIGGLMKEVDKVREDFSS